MIQKKYQNIGINCLDWNVHIHIILLFHTNMDV